LLPGELAAAYDDPRLFVTLSVVCHDIAWFNDAASPARPARACWTATPGDEGSRLPASGHWCASHDGVFSSSATVLPWSPRTVRQTQNGPWRPLFLHCDAQPNRAWWHTGFPVWSTVGVPWHTMEWPQRGRWRRATAHRGRRCSGARNSLFIRQRTSPS